MALHKQGIMGIAAAIILGSGVMAGSYYLSAQDSYAFKVNGEVVTNSEFSAIIEQEKKRYAGQIGMDFNSDMGKTMLASLKKQVLDSMIAIELITQKAEEMNLTVSQDDVNQQIDKIVKEHFRGDKASMEAALKQEKMTFKQLEEDIKKQLLRSKIFEQVTKTIKITDDDAKKHYDGNISFYTKPESIQAKHILIKSAGADKDEEAKKKAKDIIAKLKAGEEFEKLAKEFSEDTSNKDRGGDLGAFKKGDMVKPFEEAAWALENEKYTEEPVKTNFGYHVILRGKTLPATVMPFEEVKKNIIQQLEAEKQQGAWKEWMESTRKAAKIEYGPKFEIPKPPPPKAPTSQLNNTQSIEIEKPTDDKATKEGENAPAHDGHNHQ